MVSTAKAVAGIIPGVMSMGLLGESMKTLPNWDDLQKGRSKKHDAQFLKSATNILVGVPLVGVVAGQVNALP